MPLKSTFTEKVTWFIETMGTNQASEITLSIKPNKRFSDVVAYIRKGSFGKGLAGALVKDTDTGFMYVYEYAFNNQARWKYRITIQHRGETIDSLTLFRRDAGAAVMAKNDLNQLEKKVPDYDGKE